jgi:hypothetical protein
VCGLQDVPGGEHHRLELRPQPCPVIGGQGRNKSVAWAEQALSQIVPHPRSSSIGGRSAAPAPVRQPRLLLEELHSRSGGDYAARPAVSARSTAWPRRARSAQRAARSGGPVQKASQA